jgi:cytochrome c biogenesis factor
MTPSTLVQFFSQILTMIPLLAVCTCGLVACGVYWRRAQRAASLTSVGIILMLLAAIGGTLLQTLVIQSRTRTTGGSSMASISNELLLISFLRSTINAVGVAFVIAAAFAQRDLAAPPRGFDIPLAHEAGPTPQ